MECATEQSCQVSNSERVAIFLTPTSIETTKYDGGAVEQAVWYPMLRDNSNVSYSLQINTTKFPKIYVMWEAKQSFDRNSIIGSFNLQILIFNDQVMS